MAEECWPTIDVECYAGYRGEQTPRRFGLEGDWVEIVDVLDSWLAPDHRYFKVRSAQGDVYILRHDVSTHTWDVTLFKKAPKS
jgi:hypothetical protein